MLRDAPAMGGARPRLALVVIALALSASAARAVDVLFSGQTIAAVIDVDGDGPDASDCVFRAVFTPPTYEIVKEQAPATHRMCTGTSLLELLYVGQDSSSDFAGFEYSGSGQSASGGSPPFPSLTDFIAAPHVIELLDESETTAPDGLPIEVNQIEWESPIDNEVARAEICDSGAGPVLQQALLGDLLAVEIPFVPFPSQAAPTHFALQGLPFERTPPDQGTFETLDVYLPVTAGGAYTVANADTPGQLFLDVHFDELAPCSSVIGVTPEIPTLGTLGAAVLVLVIAATSVAVLRRRHRARQ